MRKTLFILTILILTGFGFGFAQANLPEPSFDPRVWVGSAAAFAAFIFAAVSFVKKNFLDLAGWRTIAASYGLGTVVAAILSFTGIYDASVIEAVLFGASAATLASGGKDGIGELLGKVRAAR